ncbi:hypothetical protein BGW41_001904 [Actinomortierella wolfii]|nr:hypothetical protein BGW41_001904 [Actinomortierella wolfii]
MEDTDTQIKYLGPFTLSQDPPLYLTTLYLSDVSEMVRVLNINQEVYNGTASWEYPFNEEHAKFRITRALDYHTSKGINTHWALRTSVDGPLIGLIAVYEPPEESGNIYLSFWISPEHSGKGYTSRAVLFVKDEIAIKGMNARAVLACAFEHNKASQRILEKAGLKSIGVKSSFVPKFDRKMEHVSYAWCPPH